MASSMYQRDDPYLNWRTPLHELELSAHDSALLVIDIQYSDAHPDFGTFALKRKLGLDSGIDDYVAALSRVIPNVQRLQQAFRGAGIQVMFSRIQSLTADGRDRGQIHKDQRISCPPGSKEAQILDEVAPIGDEIVFSKTTGSVFNSAPIHHVLSSMGVRKLVMCGVMTSGCVESAARDATDLGYGVIVASDACASWTKELHDASLRVMNGVFSRVRTTGEVLSCLGGR